MPSYEHVVVYSLPQFSSVSGAPTLLAQQLSASAHVTALIGDNFDDVLLHADREGAFRSGVLTGLLRGTRFDPEEAVAEARRKRREACGRNALLMLKMTGPATLDLSEPNVEKDGVVLGFDLADKRVIRSLTDPLIERIVAGISLAADAQSPLRRLVDSIYFFDDVGRPHYVGNPGVGTLTVTASRPYDDDARRTLKDLGERALQASAIDRVLELYSESLRDGHDRFRQFVTAWTALEVLLGKAFKTYEDRFYEDAGASVGPAGGVLHRIREVMKGKYSAADRFLVVAAYLRPSEVDKDLVVFKRVKKVRDRLVHGENVDDAQLPLNELTSLLRALLRAYLLRGA